MKRHTRSIVIAAALSAMTIIPMSSCTEDPALSASVAQATGEPLEEVTFGGVTAVNSRFSDSGFSQGDKIYVFHKASENAFFGYSYKQYSFKSDVFIPLNSDQKIMKKRSDILYYAAFSSFQDGDNERWNFYSGQDILGTFEKTADMNVDLVFVHIPAKLCLQVLNVPSNTFIYNVKLKNIVRTYYIETQAPNYFGADYSDVNIADREMSYVSTNNYVYYVPPVHEVDATGAFIVVQMSNGDKYYFAAPHATEFDPNTQYLWQVDIAKATPAKVNSRSGNIAINSSELVKIEKMNQGEIPFHKRK